MLIDTAERANNALVYQQLAPHQGFLASARGFLLIGDPHVCSSRPGRRKDDYLASVLAKLRECAALCTLHNLVPVVLGDLLHRNDDNSLKMLNRLTRVLKLFPVPPIVLEGNHDKEQTELTEADALALLALNGVVHVATTSGVIGVFNFGGKMVRLWGCPYGQVIPSDLGEFDGQTVMISHHDMAFGSAYPGATELSEVLHCTMVVNGHMHDTKKPVLVGGTWWTNPGNIEPLSVDLADHVPCAWEWAPGMAAGALNPHQLQHGVDLFDMGGLQVVAATGDEAVVSMEAAASKFAAMLSEASVDAEKTDDASVMLQDLDAVLAASGVSDATQKLMQAVAAGVVKRAHGHEQAQPA